MAREKLGDFEWFAVWSVVALAVLTCLWAQATWYFVQMPFDAGCPSDEAGLGLAISAWVWLLAFFARGLQGRLGRWIRWAVLALLLATMLCWGARVVRVNFARAGRGLGHKAVDVILRRSYAFSIPSSPKLPCLS